MVDWLATWPDPNRAIVGGDASQTNNSGRIKEIKDSQTVYTWT
jgi:hypothetical protein